MNRILQFLKEGVLSPGLAPYPSPSTLYRNFEKTGLDGNAVVTVTVPCRIDQGHLADAEAAEPFRDLHGCLSFRQPATYPLTAPAMIRDNSSSASRDRLIFSSPSTAYSLCITAV